MQTSSTKLRYELLDVPIDIVTLDQARDRILEAARTPLAQNIVATPNPEILLCAQQNQQLLELLRTAWMNIPDGTGILWASTFQTKSRGRSFARRIFIALTAFAALVVRPSYCRSVFPQRVTGTDLMLEICRSAQPFGLRIFLLGGRPHIVKKTKEQLLRGFPHLNIVGALSGCRHDSGFGEIQRCIEKAQPHILFVAFGAPNQELWIAKHLKKFPSVRVAMGVGGAFDFIAGARFRAPKLFRSLGLEWMVRLLQEPSRIVRIWNAVVRFPLKILFLKK